MTWRWDGGALWRRASLGVVIGRTLGNPNVPFGVVAFPLSAPNHNASQMSVLAQNKGTSRANVEVGLGTSGQAE